MGLNGRKVFYYKQHTNKLKHNIIGQLGFEVLEGYHITET